MGRIWLSWLRCGAGGDRLDHFAPSVAMFWQRLAAASSGPHDQGDFLLSAHLLELALEILRLRGSEVEDLATGVNVDKSKEGQYSILM
eukprot:s178_g11.t1